MTALALRDDQNQWEPQQLAALRQTGIDEDISEAELQVFLHECQRRKLDPFTRQIYLIGRKDTSKGGRKVYRSQTGIDGFRVIARRAAEKSGIDYSYEDTIWFDAAGHAHLAWVRPEAPAAAKVVVVRNGQRFDAVARYGAYVQTDRDGNPLKQWRTMPDVMIAKCAEALALRKAFPEDLGGIYTEEEMGQADNPQTVRATAETVREERPVNGGRQQNPAAQLQAPRDQGAWANDALKRARKIRTDAEGDQLVRETADAVIKGWCTPKQRDYIENSVERTLRNLRGNARPVAAEDLAQQAAATPPSDEAAEKEAAARILRPLADDDPWRAKVDEIGDDAEEARAALWEIRQLRADGQMDEPRADRISRAIVARCPKAAIEEGGSDG